VHVDPELVAVLGTFTFGGLIGTPRLARAWRRRRRTLRECLRCGRTVILGERSCDCGD
jgi:hypothetical protein